VGSIIFARFILKEQPSLSSILCTVPIISGVILVSSRESDVTYSLLFILLSNLLFNFRNVASKNLLHSTILQDPTALFYLINLIGSCICLPFMFLELNASLFSLELCSAGVFHFLYNWCSFLLIVPLSALSHAIGNVMKRAVVVILAILFYNSSMFPTTVIGIALCIGGSVLYTHTSKDTTKAPPSRAMWAVVVFSLCMLLVPFVSQPLPSNTRENKTQNEKYFTEPPQNTLQAPIVTTVFQNTNAEQNQPHFILFWTRAENNFPARLEKSIESILYHHRNAIVTLYASYLDGQVPLTELSKQFPNQIKIERIEVL
jgi:drug/metabolite transporter (DMT)-like permease